MQLLPETAKGIALRTGGTRVRRGRSARPRDQRPLRLVVPRPPARPLRRRPAAPRSPRTTPGRGTSTTGARRAWGSSSRRRGPTSRTRARRRGGLRGAPTPTSSGRGETRRADRRRWSASRRVRGGGRARSPAGRSRARAGRRSRRPPRRGTCRCSSAETSERSSPAAWPVLDPAAAPLARLRRRDREPALAEPRVRLQAAAELEVDGEPVGLVLRHGLEQRVEAVLGEERVKPLVVLGREGEEELLLRGEPVEDRARGRGRSPARGGRPSRPRSRAARSNGARRRARACGARPSRSRSASARAHFTKQYVRLIFRACLTRETANSPSFSSTRASASSPAGRCSSSDAAGRPLLEEVVGRRGARRVRALRVASAGTWPRARGSARAARAHRVPPIEGTRSRPATR